MIRCPFCDHKNPEGATRCASCKADLTSGDREAGAGGVSDSGGAEALSLDGRIIALLAHGRTIEAIKLYRDITGAGLKEAKDAVEALERGGVPPSRSAASSGDDAEILELMRAGHKIRAIKLYRDKTGAGLADAKNAVEAMARAHGLPAGQSGCGTTVLAAILLALLLGLVR
jgi:large subunit ribosomal protein L7/L12